jgi:REase_MTES_1575
LLDRPGGDRLLTATIAAAREQLTVVSGFGADDLNPRRLITPGAQALRGVLDDADASTDLVGDGEPANDAVEAAIADRMRAAGVDVVVGLGHGLARIPIAARHPARKDRLVLAVDTDGPTYAARPTVRDRDRLRPEQLARLGWAVHRVWSTAWIDDPDRETERLLAAYEAAVSAADAYDWAEAAALADDVVGMPDDRAGWANAVGEGSASEGDPELESAESAVEPEPATPQERGPRPRIDPGRPVGCYTRQELAAVARWIDSDGRTRTEAEAITEIAHELALPDRAPRAEDSLRHAVRVARAGAPPLWPDRIEAPSDRQPAGVESPEPS